MNPVPVLMTSPQFIPMGWNPSDLTSGTKLSTLSNANTTLNSVGASVNFGATRCTQSRSSGKYYFEVRIDAGLSGVNHPFIGLVPNATAINSFAPGPFGTANQWGLFMSSPPSSGHVDYVPGGVSGALQAPAAVGDVYGVAIDFSGGGKLWFNKNGTWDSGNPATGTSPVFTGMSGTFFPFATVGNSVSGDIVTGRFDSFNQQYLPSGFTAWSGV